jgi:hypothetical protein
MVRLKADLEILFVALAEQVQRLAPPAQAAE